jgi:hypothetical protein
MADEEQLEITKEEKKKAFWDRLTQREINAESGHFNKQIST